jgi:hypothetical protein
MCYLGTTILFAAVAGGGAAELPPPALEAVEGLHESARARYERIDSYIARLTRREVVKGERKPEEVLLFKFRQRPWSVHMKWLGREGRGREGVYVQGRHQGKIHTLLAAGDMPFVPAGRRMALEPDGALMRAASSHPVTELGIGASIDKIGGVLAAQRRGNHRFGRLSPVGPVRRPEFNEPVRGVEHSMPAGADPAVPRGGSRTYYFDPHSGLPTLLVTRDEVGSEVEYYRYDRLQESVKLDDDDFDPDVLWGPPQR